MICFDGCGLKVVAASQLIAAEAARDVVRNQLEQFQSPVVICSVNECPL